MKLYQNVSRFRYRRSFPKGGARYKMLLWALALKPGDVVATCFGFNSRVVSTEPQRMGALHGGWYIDEVRITDTSGRWHYAGSSGGCVWPKETVEQIHRYWSMTDEDLANWETQGGGGFMRTIVTALREGRTIVDSDGVLLAEFESVRNSSSSGSAA